MEFLYCQDCGRLYFVHEVKWAKLPTLDWAEFTEDNDEQRGFCARHHCCEVLVVISDVVLGDEEDIYRRVLVFCVKNEAGVPAVIVKTRKCLSEAPVYQYYPSLNGTPLDIGRLLDVTV